MDMEIVNLARGDRECSESDFAGPGGAPPTWLRDVVESLGADRQLTSLPRRRRLGAKMNCLLGHTLENANPAWAAELTAWAKQLASSNLRRDSKYQGATEHKSP